MRGGAMVVDLPALSVDLARPGVVWPLAGRTTARNPQRAHRHYMPAAAS